MVLSNEADFLGSAGLRCNNARGLGNKPLGEATVMGDVAGGWGEMLIWLFPSLLGKDIPWLGLTVIEIKP
jgi:hypothetical protein